MEPALILQHYGVKPSRKLSQNFLIDEPILMAIADTCHIEATDLVIEIGSGIGNLTEHLLTRAGHVVGIEFDRAMQAILIDRFKEDARFSLEAKDVLQVDLGLLAKQHGWRSAYRRLIIAGNIPYAITGLILRHLAEMDPRPDSVTLLVQKEVALRMSATPPDMSLLSLSLQIAGDVEMVTLITKDRFWPQPDVDSAVVRWIPYETPRLSREKEAGVLSVAKNGFSQKRKKLRNTLAAAWDIPPADVEKVLHRAKIDPGLRAEALSIEDWTRLLDTRIS